MRIPEPYAQVNHFYTGVNAPSGAQVTYGVIKFPNFDDAAVEAEYFHTQWCSYILAQQTEDITCTKTLFKAGPNEDGPSAEFSDPTNGTLTGSSTSPAISALIKKGTALGGKKHRGRLYLPSMREADVNESGLITSGQVDELQNVFNGWRAQLEGDDYLLVLLHAYLLDDNDEPLPENQQTEPDTITSLTVDPVVATQRRRQRR